MDDLREPTGDLPQEVYVRRRIVAGLGLVLVIVVLYFLISSPSGGGESDDKGAAASSPDPSTTETTQSPQPTDAAQLDASRACTAADVLLTVTPTPFTFATGSAATFDVSIKQQGTSPCMLDTAAAGTNFTVWSGGDSNRDMYFDTSYCDADTTITSRQMLMQPGTEEKLAISWSGTRVGEGCTQGGQATDGYYWAKLTVQGIESEPAQFQLAS